MTDQFETFTHLDEGPVTVIEADAAGNLWFGGGFWGTGNEGKGLWRYDGQRFNQFTTEDGLDSDAISALHCADDGTIWIGHLYGGISRYDLQPEIEARNQRKFTTFSQADGVIWFGRFAWGRPKGGLIRYDGRRFEMLTTEDGLIFQRYRLYLFRLRWRFVARHWRNGNAPQRWGGPVRWTRDGQL